MTKERIRVTGETINYKNLNKNDDRQSGDKSHMDLGVREGDVIKTRIVEDVDGTKYTIQLRNCKGWHVVGHDFGVFTELAAFKKFLVEERNRKKNAG